MAALRPLAEADRAALARVDGLVFDIDDTVTRDGRLERIAYDAMWRMREAGLRLVSVTGRPLGWADVVARHWPVDAAVGENGAGWVWRDGAVVREGYFHSAEERVAQVALLERIRRRVAEELPEVALAPDQRARRCDLAFDVGEHVQLPTETIDRIVALVEAEGARCPVSSVHAHVVPGAWDKPRGVVRAVREALAVDLEADRERWVFVGDSGNDAEAFAWFAQSVGVANVREHLHRLAQPPAWITQADRGEGFAELADALLGARVDGLDTAG